MTNSEVIDFSEFIKELPGEETSPGLVFYNNSAYIFLKKCTCRIKGGNICIPRGKALSVDPDTGFLCEASISEIKKYLKYNFFDRYMKNYLYFDKKQLIEKIHEDSSRRNEKERKQLEFVFLQNAQIEVNIISKNSQKFIAKITPEMPPKSNIRFFEGSVVRYNLLSFYTILLSGLPCCDIIGLKSNETDAVLFYKNDKLRMQWQFKIEDSIHKKQEGV